MTKRTMLLLLVVEERSDSEPPMYDAADDEPSRIVQTAPKAVLAKCAPKLFELARKAGAL
jgi:hypothetical protein